MDAGRLVSHLGTTFLLIFVVPVLHSQQLKAIAENSLVMLGTTFQKGTEFTFGANGKIASVVLVADQPIADKTFGKQFSNVWKKGTVLDFTSLFKDSVVPEMPRKIHVVDSQQYKGHLLMKGCTVSPNSMVLTMGDTKEYSVDSVSVTCDKEITIKGKKIPAEKSFSIYSEKKVTIFDDSYKEVEF